MRSFSHIFWMTLLSLTWSAKAEQAPSFSEVRNALDTLEKNRAQCQSPLDQKRSRDTLTAYSQAILDLKREWERNYKAWKEKNRQILSELRITEQNDEARGAKLLALAFLQDGKPLSDTRAKTLMKTIQLRFESEPLLRDQLPPLPLFMGPSKDGKEQERYFNAWLDLVLPLDNDVKGIAKIENTLGRSIQDFTALRALDALLARRYAKIYEADAKRQLAALTIEQSRVAKLWDEFYASEARSKNISDNIGRCFVGKALDIPLTLKVAEDTAAEAKLRQSLKETEKWLEERKTVSH